MTNRKEPQARPPDPDDRDQQESHRSRTILAQAIEGGRPPAAKASPIGVGFEFEFHPHTLAREVGHLLGDAPICN